MANIINGTDTGSGGLITTGDSSDELQLQTAETARVTLTNTAVVVNEGGNDVDFRVESDTDANALFVEGSTGNIGSGITPSNYSGYRTLALNGSSAGGQIDVYANSVAQGYLYFSTGSAGLGTTVSAPLIFATNNAEAARFNTSGNLAFPNGQGIDFSASAGGGASSSILDDYEEGTFTATLTPEASGTITINSGVDLLAYTKIGRVVFIQGLLEVQSVGSPTGTAVAIGGLPFTTADLTEYAGRSGGAIYVTATTTGAFGVVIFESTTTAGILVPANTVQAGTQFYVQFNYIAA